MSLRLSWSVRASSKASEKLCLEQIKESVFSFHHLGPKIKFSHQASKQIRTESSHQLPRSTIWLIRFITNRSSIIAYHFINGETEM